MTVKLKPKLRLVKLKPTIKPAVQHPPLPRLGNDKAEVLIVLDPRVMKGEHPDPLRYTSPLLPHHGRLLAEHREAAGIERDSVCIVSCSMPVHEEVWGRDSALNKAISADREQLLTEIGLMKPKLILAMGKSAARQVTGRAVKITKARGQPYYDEALKTIILPTLGPAHVARQPEHKDLFTADMETAARIINAGYKLDYASQVGKDYKWCTDLSPYFGAIRRNKAVAVDCEWTSYGKGPNEWYNPNCRILTVQLCWEPGKALVIPIDYRVNGIKPNPAVKARVIKQLGAILGNPFIRKVGHNFKGDYLSLKAMLGIKTRGYRDDTLLMVHAIDENMLNKSQNDCVRRWVPEMAGYNDELDRDPEHVGKTRMDLMSPAKMLRYSGGDADANWRLYERLRKIIRLDEKSYNCYRHVPMAAMIAFCDLEQEGFTVSIDALEALEKQLEAKLYGNPKKPTDTGDYGRLIQMIPASIRREFENTGVGLQLTRPELIRATLFTHPDGLKLKPTVFTKSTAKLKDVNRRVPSTSAKQHLPYFRGLHPLIDGLIDFAKDEHLLTANIKAFYKYIFNPWVDPVTGERFGKIHPSYLLHGTVTGRTSSKNPNGQNTPKRAPKHRQWLIKLYRAIFRAPKDHVLIEADFSQLELRLVAIAAKCKAMLKVYRDGGDIHCFTAANLMGLTLPEFMKLKETDPQTYEHKRFQAKAVNFGLVYSMGWRKFIVYARVEYDLVISDDEAQNIVARYFEGFPELRVWQEASRRFAKRKGYVRAFDGRKRHLPSVDSDDEQISAGAERQGINSPIQGFGNDLGLMAIARITAQVAKELLRLCGFIHDAIIGIAHKSRAIEAARTIKQFMETNPLKEWFDFEPPIPILADVSISDTSLAELKELHKDVLADTNIVSWDDFKAHMKAKEPKAQTFAVKLKPRKAA